MKRITEYIVNYVVENFRKSYRNITVIFNTKKFKSLPTRVHRFAMDLGSS